MLEFCINIQYVAGSMECLPLPKIADIHKFIFPHQAASSRYSKQLEVSRIGTRKRRDGEAASASRLSLRRRQQNIICCYCKSFAWPTTVAKRAWFAWMQATSFWANFLCSLSSKEKRRRKEVLKCTHTHTHTGKEGSSPDEGFSNNVNDSTKHTLLLYSAPHSSNQDCLFLRKEQNKSSVMMICLLSIVHV